MLSFPLVHALVVSGGRTVSLLRRASFPLETSSSLQTVSPLSTSMLRTAWANLSGKMYSPLATWPDKRWRRGWLFSCSKRRGIYDFGPSLTSEEADRAIQDQIPGVKFVEWRRKSKCYRCHSRKWLPSYVTPSHWCLGMNDSRSLTPRREWLPKHFA